MLTSTRTEFEGRAMATALEAEGIACHVFATSAMAVQWEGGIANAVRVMVRRGDLDAARAALAQSRLDARGVNWSDVDVGEPDGEISPGPRGELPARTRGRAPWMHRVRIIGLVLIFLPMMITWSGVMNAWIPVALGVAIIISAWNTGGGGVAGGAGRGTEGRVSASPPGDRGSA